MRFEYHRRQVGPREVLLVGYVPVGGNEGVELLACGFQQLAVLLARLASLGHGRDFVSFVEGSLGAPVDVLSSRSTRKVGGLEGHLQVCFGFRARHGREVLEQIVEGATFLTIC
jgi:hypothetical protein